MAAYIEKVVVYADRLDAEKLLPQGRYRALRRCARLDELLGQVKQTEENVAGTEATVLVRIEESQRLQADVAADDLLGAVKEILQ